jgi:mannose-1-phosphate guanylyltransferase
MDDGDECLLIYADNLSNVDLLAFLNYHRSHPDPFTMMLFHAPEPRQCGIAELDESGRVIAFVEKPEHPKSDLANAGVYAVTAEAYREIADLAAFDFGFEVLPRYTGRMRGWICESYYRDIGTLEALREAERLAPDIFELPESRA